MVISFVWIVLMRFVAGFMVWFSIVAVLALQGVGNYSSIAITVVRQDDQFPLI